MKEIKKIKIKKTKAKLSSQSLFSLRPLKLKQKLNKLLSNKKLEKLFFQQLKFSRLTLIVLGIVLCIFVLFLILNFIFIINLNLKLKQDLTNLENKTNVKIEAISDSVNSTNAANTVIGTLNSFGDHFSGLAFINQAKTNMNWDENETAFTFPPLYNFEKVTDLADEISINKPASKISPRLVVANNALYYRGRKLKLPAELAQENILNIKVDLIGSRWLVGIVTGKDYDERAWVYIFNGQNFTPLVTKTTEIKIEPKYERLGGVISFGGTADNFLIVYGGYDGHILYYYQGTLTDVSKFFGLRVSDGGFSPEIISRSNSRGTVFYICSQSTGKPKLIKLWSKHEGELMGALDFSPLIFTNDLGATDASCRFEEAESNLNNQTSGKTINILMEIKKNKGSNEGNNERSNEGSLETWRFSDRGFDNSADREVVSTDLGLNRGRKIISAAILAVDVASDGTVENENYDETNSKAEIFLGNQENNWQKIKLGEWLKFSEVNESLFWRATFKAEPSYSDYSPWFSHINQLDYKTF